MKSIKPGRGPSGMSAVGSVFAAIFGVFWTIMASSMGAPIFFTLFGIGFIVLAVVQAVYHYSNATNRNRMSLYDITDHNEESDPLQPRMDIENRDRHMNGPQITDARFCPYCGLELHEEFSFCPRCGKMVKANEYKE